MRTSRYTKQYAHFVFHRGENYRPKVGLRSQPQSSRRFFALVTQSITMSFDVSQCNQAKAIVHIGTVSLFQRPFMVTDKARRLLAQ